MRVRIMLQITDDTGASGAVEEVAVFEKATERRVGRWRVVC